jgi:hypothetical protein
MLVVGATRGLHLGRSQFPEITTRSKVGVSLCSRLPTELGFDILKMHVQPQKAGWQKRWSHSGRI